MIPLLPETDDMFPARFGVVRSGAVCAAIGLGPGQARPVRSGVVAYRMPALVLL